MTEATLIERVRASAATAFNWLVKEGPTEDRVESAREWLHHRITEHFDERKGHVQD